MTRKLGILVAGLALLALAVPVLAQNGPNGGLVAGAGHHKTELVVGQTELTVFLLEDGKPHVAKLPAPLDKGAIVVLSGKDHHGDRFNARYVIK